MTALSELKQGWALVFACAVGFGLGLSGMPFYTHSVFIGPLRETFGWSMAFAQFGLTVSYLTTMVAIPITGWLADKYGARRVVLASIVLFSLSYMALGLLDGGRFSFIFIWFLIAATGTGTLSLTWSRALSGRFDKGRGLALGLALLGTGVVGFAGPPVARMLVQAYGWRIAYVCLGALPLIFSLPLALRFFREAAGGQIRTHDSQGHSLGAALRDWRLWVMGVCFFMIAFGVTGLIPNLIKIVMGNGLTMSQAVVTASMIGLFVIFGRVLCGALLDHFWAPGVALAFLILPAIACLILAQSGTGPWVAAFAAALIGLTAGAEFDLLPYLVGRYFGLARFGAILGVVSAFFYLGASIGAPMLGWIYDRQGSFGPGLWAVGVLFVASALGLLLLGRYPADVKDTHAAPVGI